MRLAEAMILAKVIGATLLAKWTVVLYLTLLGATILAGLWLLRSRPQTSYTQDQTPRSQAIRLCQVNPAESDLEDGLGTEIDIIAIHGLDTNSPDTWKYRIPSNGKSGTVDDINWLADPDMLPKVTGRARIYTCDWPADLLQQSSTPTTLHECANSLRKSIIQHLDNNSGRQVLFIASCLGGIILIKALEIDNRPSDNNEGTPTLTRGSSLAKATRGIVFLATPFRGTAFENMPVFLLKTLSFLRDQTVTALVDYAQGATSNLNTTTKNLLELSREHGYEVYMFWEGRNTVLLRKFYLAWIVSRQILTVWLIALILSWLLDSFSPWLLVLFLLWLPAFWSCQPQPVGP